MTIMNLIKQLNPSMEENQNPQEQTCKECGSQFMATHPKHQYCQASCRKAHYFKLKAQQEKDQQLRQKTAQLKALQPVAHIPARSIAPATNQPPGVRSPGQPGG